MKIVSSGLLMVVLLISCSDKEKKEKALKDLELAQQALVDVKRAISDSEEALTKHLAELEVAKDDMNQVKEFQLLRTEAEREEQIRKTTEYKMQIEKNIETIKHNIEFYQDSARRAEVRISNLKDFLKN